VASTLSIFVTALRGARSLTFEFTFGCLAGDFLVLLTDKTLPDVKRVGMGWRLHSTSHLVRQLERIMLQVCLKLFEGTFFELDVVTDELGVDFTLQ